MELILPGFEDQFVIDTAHNDDGTRWADVYQKINGQWKQFKAFRGETSLGEAFDCLIEDGLEMTEDQVYSVQEDLPQNIYVEP